MAQQYNGWANYATWRVQLEILDDYVSSQDDRMLADMSQYDCAEHLKDYVDEVLTGFGENEEGLAISYAQAFVDICDWSEMAEHAQDDINERFPENAEDAE